MKDKRLIFTFQCYESISDTILNTKKITVKAKTEKEAERKVKKLTEDKFTLIHIMEM